MEHITTNKRWYYGQADSLKVLTDAYERCIDDKHKEMYPPDKMAVMTYASGGIPSVLGKNKIISVQDRSVLQQILNGLINCGCGKVRKDLSEAVAKLDALGTFKAAKEGVKAGTEHLARSAKSYYYKILADK